jgi:hypothetical protein
MRFFYILVVTLLVGVIPSISQAKFTSISHSYSFSSSSHSYSSHSFSYSKPSAPSQSFSYSKPSAPSTSFAYSKPSSSTPFVSTGSSSRTASNSFNRSGSFAVANTSRTTYSSLNSYSTKYKQPPLVVSHTYYNSPSYTRVYTTYHNPDGYWAARQSDLPRFYSRYPEPSYVYNMRPSYGLWDTYFLYLLLANVADNSYGSANWAYAHQNDPGYQQWYADEQSQATTNAQVAQQLASLNQQVAALKAQNAPPQSDDVLPNGVSPDIAIAPTVVSLKCL